ncbi:glycoside hydrolase family 15 protein [Streptomyces sp. NPDC059262]|uniref:glycoside hydrolase family 15 protein n=1 Tax=Streptomyces sp. NPDC059262 TaxID=3346797 RepID=UPI0036B8EAC8
MDRYPPIAEHGLVGDLQTAALVSSQGVVDWFAAPRFDSPSIFAALLDHDGGGYMLLAPERSDVTCKQLYYPDTAILMTRFMSPDGVGEVVDFMPPDRTRTATDRHTLMRVVRGTVEFTLECRPRFDYGRAEHQLELGENTGLFRSPGMDAHLQASFPLERDGRDVRGRVTLSAGESGGVVFTVCASGGEAPASLTVDGLTAQADDTGQFWQEWLRQSRYRGRWPELVHRSVITLKLLTYAPTGALVAAATMGLPEQVGGERTRTLDWFAEAWDRPDEGIWETRGGRQSFTFSRVMSWAAFDQGLRLAEHFRRPADVAKWRSTRDTILEQVMEHGWSEQEGAFVQHYGGDVLDASLLLMPRVQFVAPRDPAWLATLDAMDRKLVSDSLVYRYDPAASPDGLRGSEGTFSLCTFLYADAPARAGRLPQARYTFEKMQTHANHIGLFAEEIGPSGGQLGNFPQAFTHLSLIMAATTLDEALDAESRR